MKVLRTVSVLMFAALLLFSCSSKREYKPFYYGIEKGDTQSPKVMIKAIGKVRISKVDNHSINNSLNDKVKNFFSFGMRKIGADSLVLNEGEHEISIKINLGSEIDFPKINFVAENEYIIDYSSSRRGNLIHYNFWIVNKTTGNVVAGKKE